MTGFEAARQPWRGRRETPVAHMCCCPALAKTTCRMRIAITMCALLVAAPASDAAAQAVYGSIGGIVKDASGGLVPGATVTVTSLEHRPGRIDFDDLGWEIGRASCRERVWIPV